MSYRTITVDGEEYKYTVSKKFIKVRGHGVYSRWDYDTKDYDKSAVTPGTIASWVKAWNSYKTR